MINVTMLLGIKENAFKKNKSFSFVEFQNNYNFKNIGKYAFSNSIIHNITIPSSVTIINEGAFEGCTELKYVTFKIDSQLPIN